MPAEVSPLPRLSNCGKRSCIATAPLATPTPTRSLNRIGRQLDGTARHRTRFARGLTLFFDLGLFGLLGDDDVGARCGAGAADLRRMRGSLIGSGAFVSFFVAAGGAGVAAAALSAPAFAAAASAATGVRTPSFSGCPRNRACRLSGPERRAAVA